MNIIEGATYFIKRGRNKQEEIEILNRTGYGYIIVYPDGSKRTMPEKELKERVLYQTNMIG